MSNIEQLVNSILSRHNLSTEHGRERAYEECVEYAEKEMGEDLRCNEFLRVSAQMLEKEPVEYDIVRDIVAMSENARVDVAYDERQGLIVTANAEGLEYLTDVLQTLAKAPVGEHAHFFNDEEPLTPLSFNMVIFFEDDEWFDRMIEEAANSEEDADDTMVSMLAPEDIYAFQIIGPIPPALNMTRGRIYRVRGVEEGEAEESWKKTAPGKADGYAQFNITDDNGDDFRIILHLEDRDVHFFKKEDFEGLNE